MKYKNKYHLSQKPANKSRMVYGVIFIVAILLIFAAAAYNRYISNEERMPTTTTEDQASKNKDNPDDTSPEEQPQSTNDTSGLQSTGDQIQRNPEYQPPQGGSITITRIESSEQTVTIAALVQGIDNGTCRVTYTRDSLSVAGEAPVQQGPSYFACQIDIPRNQFSASGTWSATLRATGDNAQTQATSEVTL